VGATVGHALNGIVWWREGWALGHRPVERIPVVST
jgi:hypothetical protein